MVRGCGKKLWVVPVLDRVDMVGTRASSGCENETVNKSSVGPEKINTCQVAS